MNLTEALQEPDTERSHYTCERCHKRQEEPTYNDIHVFGQVYMIDCTLYYLCTACSSGLAEISQSYCAGHPVTLHNDDGTGYTWRWPEVTNG